jgi:hypothetical protein
MSNKKIILVLIFLIFCFGFLSYWHFQKFWQALNRIDLSKNLPKIKMPEVLKIPEMKDWLNYDEEKIRKLFPQLNP